MLQWTGGSRRKVATSRKSIEKRQRQYFEQRRRQQQEHGVAFIETSNDGLVSDRHKANRSLDILSLLSVSKAAEECRRHCDNISTVSHRATSTGSSKGVDSTTHQLSRIIPTSINHEATARDEREPIIARSPSSHQIGTTTSESTRRSTSNIRNAESGCHKNVSANLIYPLILDLIGNDGTISDSKGSPVHEEHVAFPIKGLGNIGTETPMQSPQRPGRKSSEDHSSFTKSFKNTHPFKSFNKMLDDLGVDEECLANTEKPNGDDQLYSFPTSEDVLYPFNYVGQVESVPKNSVQPDKPFQMNYLHEQDRHRNLWNSDFQFLDNDGSDKRCRLNWGNVNATDNPYSWRNDSQDLEVEGCNSPFRSSFPCNYGPQAGYSSFQKPWEDPRDNLTWLSDECCSSNVLHLKPLVDEDPWLFDEGFLHSNKKARPGSFYPSDNPSFFGRGDEDTVAEFSSDNPSFFEPSYLGKQPLHGSFPKTCSGESWLGIHRDFEIHVHSSLEDADLFGYMESTPPIPDLSAQGSATEEDRHKPKGQPPASKNLVQLPTCSKNITSESWSCGDSNLKDCGNSLDEPPMEVMQQDTNAYSSNEKLKETSLNVVAPHESQERMIGEELLGTDPAKHQQDPKAKHVDNEYHNGPKTVSFEPPCHVMMVERYDFQLFCFKKRAELLFKMPARSRCDV